jgi:dolichol-phosphate mannosyltransferase
MKNMETSIHARSVSPQHQDTPDLSIVIPCYNEVSIIARTIERILDHVKNVHPHYLTEVVIVNDGSTDGTRQTLEDLSEQFPQIRTITFGKNQGRGAALKQGITQSRGKYVITMDADLSYDVDHITEILHAFERKADSDAIIVSAYMKGGVVKGVPFKRLLLSRVANWILSGFFQWNLSTVTCVARGYRGSLIRKLPLFESDKETHLEILRKLAICGANVREIPGRLIWKEKKKRAGRIAGKRIFGSSVRHILYGMLSNPTRLFKYVLLSVVLMALFTVA